MREVEQEIIPRRPEHSVDLALDRMADLVGFLGDPQRACPVIHITGTNGKTSTARMVDALLRSRGLRTGRFTSPHLVSIRERICVDGAPVSPERFVEGYEEILPFVAMVDERHPVPMSFFEVLTGMAFAIFADTPVDVMVLEVGVGGRLRGGGGGAAGEAPDLHPPCCAGGGRAGFRDRTGFCAAGRRGRCVRARYCRMADRRGQRRPRRANGRVRRPGPGRAG